MLRFRRLAVAVLAAGVAAAPIHAAALDPRAAFADERAASGGNAWRHIAALRFVGTQIAAGAANPVRELVDHRTGSSIATIQIGPLAAAQGFDGVGWTFAGGPIMETTLPGLQADNVTQAYVARDGWWNPADPAQMTPLGTRDGEPGVRVVPRGGNPIDVWFDPRTHLIAKTVAHTDTGLTTTVMDDYRTVGDVVLSFHSVTTDPSGAVTVSQTRGIALLRSVAPSAFARPAPRSDGTIVGTPPALVPFRLVSRHGWIVVPLRIAQRSVGMIFDSGGQNYFTPAAAERLGLHGAGGVPISGVGNGSVSASIAALGSLALGDAVLRDQNGIVAPLPYVVTHPAAGVEPDGLVGQEFLEAFRTEIDFAKRRFRFSAFGQPAAHEAGAVTLPMLSDGQHAYVRAAIDGVPGVFLLDTGDADDITVFRRFADEHRLFRGRGVPYVAAGGVGGHLSFQRYRARSFALGGAVFHAPPVTVSDAAAGAFASRSVAGNIGIGIISRYDVTFDFQAHTVTLVPGPDIGRPIDSDRSGMSLNQLNSSAFVVLSVAPGSPAATAGVRVGDEILTIAGHDVAGEHLGLFDLVHYEAPTARTLKIGLRTTAGAERTVTLRLRDLLPG